MSNCLARSPLGTTLLAHQHAEKPNRNAPHDKHKHPPKDSGEGQEIGQQQRHATKVHPTCRLSFPCRARLTRGILYFTGSRFSSLRPLRMTRFGLFMFHVCALAWALVALADRAFAQCDVEVATSLVFSQGEPTEGYGLALETVAEHTLWRPGRLDHLPTVHANGPPHRPRHRCAVGDDEFPLSLMPVTSFYQNPFGNNNPEGISPAWISFYPDLAYDSWITIGLDGPSSSSPGKKA